MARATCKVIKLMPDQCAHFWPLLRANYVEANPDVGPQHLNNVLARLLSSTSQAWVVQIEGDFGGSIVSTLHKDDESKKYIEIDSLYLKGRMRADVWLKCVNTITAFATGEGCQYGMGQTWVEGISKAFSKMGASVYHRIHWDFKHFKRNQEE